jgi:hypothetical protein
MEAMMFQGTVSFQTTIKGNGIRFSVVECHSNEPGVEKVEIDGPTGYELHATIHLASVASPNDGRMLAAKVHQKALDRIAFHYGLAIESLRCVGDQFSPLNPPPDVHTVAVSESVSASDTSTVFSDIAPAELKTVLTQASPPGKRYYGLFRAARQSLSPVEEFMHLYHILLMLCNQQYQDEKQWRVEDFIKSEDPNVPETPDPRDPKVMETVYTRLRNEFGHRRVGVDLDKTKSEMATHLGGLMALTKRAIELQP